MTENVLSTSLVAVEGIGLFQRWGKVTYVSKYKRAASTRSNVWTYNNRQPYHAMCRVLSRCLSYLTILFVDPLISDWFQLCAKNEMLFMAATEFRELLHKETNDSVDLPRVQASYMSVLDVV